MRHTVYFWLDDSLTESDFAAFEAGLKALFEIETVTSGTYGKPAGTPDREGITQNDYHYSLHLEFADVEKHNAYQVDSEHDVFVDKFSKWFKQVRVFDSQIS